MVRPTVLIRLGVHRGIAAAVLVLLVAFLPLAAGAQGYEISGESSLSGSVTLTVYDGDSTTHTHSARIDRGLFLFSGTVKGPVLASLSHPSMRRPLYFYLENSEITIALNATHPEASLIKGSRSNSEYRYFLERYMDAPEPGAFLRQYVREKPADIYVPFVLYSQMQSFDEGLLRGLIGQLSGAATHTYHYTLLCRWKRETPSVSEGSEIPNFTFTNENHKQVKFSEVRNTAGATLLIFGATWCDRCQQMVTRVRRQMKGKAVSIVYIRIDDSPAGWDAPFVKQLSIDHLPYVILVDAQGRVQARDLREWEIGELKIEN